MRSDLAKAGQEMYGLMAELYPICRSISGDGFRQTLRILQNMIPIEITEIPTGTAVFDWNVPREWNIRDAYIKDSSGKKIVDFQKSNLHVMSYSIPLNRKMTLQELKPHLYSLPDHPDWIPYSTSYFNENWGFCITHRQLQQLSEGEYEVVIDSTLTKGNLTYGECFLPGRRKKEVLISSHACHPSLCNDNLVRGRAGGTACSDSWSFAGIFISFFFCSGSNRINHMAEPKPESNKKIVNGLVLACVGDSGKYNI